MTPFSMYLTRIAIELRFRSGVTPTRRADSVVLRGNTSVLVVAFEFDVELLELVVASRSRSVVLPSVAFDERSSDPFAARARTFALTSCTEREYCTALEVVSWNEEPFTTNETAGTIVGVRG